MSKLKNCSWMCYAILPVAIVAGAADFDPANNVYRAGFDPSLCANGLVEDAEQCDDGNLDAADGCASTCRIDPAFACTGTPSICIAPALVEVEPNNTAAAADANGVGFTTSRTILAAISPNADRDLFRVDIAPAFKVVRFESFTPSESDCSGGVTTTLRLLSTAAVQIVADNASGISGCTAIVLGMDTGTYYIQAEETGNNASIAGYALQARFLSDLGSESETPGTSGANDTAATAGIAVAGTRDGVVFGDHTPTADADYYAIVVPAGAGVRAEIIEGNRATLTCESNGVDSLLTLYAANGTTEKTADDDDGRGFCSLIDGTGTAPLDASARNTTGSTETWYLAVRASAGVTTGNVFTYRLAVTVR